MSNEQTTVLGRIAELQGRQVEVITRLRQDAEILVDLQREISVMMT
jgi:hypothetical protein